MPDRCEHQEVEGQRLMREAVAETYEDILGEVVLDMLQEPDAQRHFSPNFSRPA